MVLRAPATGHCFETITAAPWSAELSTFAWKLVAVGVLPVGKATGRKMEDGASV